MSEALELVTAQQERATAVSIYGQDDQVKQMIQAVRTVAPWVNNRDPKLSFSDNEVALVVRRAMAMGLDPLNPHEVQIWKDNRGAVNFQISYTLMAEWVRRFKGTHTEPEYHRLTKEELVEEGLQQTDVAYRVSFVMDDSIDKLVVLAQVYGAEKARAMVAVSGFGCAKASEYSSDYFAPAGRSKTWKVQKRAMVDAYRRKFGTPTRAEIEELRRIGGFDRVRAEDWEGTEDLHPGDAAALAQFRGQWREHEERLESDPEYRAEMGEQTRVAMAAMYPAPKTVEVEVVSDDYETANAQEATAPERPDKPKGTQPTRPYDPWTLADLIRVSIERRRISRETLGAKLDGFKRAVVGNLEACFDGNDQARHLVADYLTGKASSKAWDDAETLALHKWLNATEQDGVWVVDPLACQEAHAVYSAALQEQGQQTLFEDGAA